MAVSMSTDAEVIVVGGGVIGLAVAQALGQAGGDVLLLERHDRLGTETSSRNSEVVHAGLYYPPGSLRARLCVAGKVMLYRFASENGVAIRRCGKLLVATSDAEIARLEDVRRTAARNGVDDLRWLEAADARALEPEVVCVAACLSPSTGILDSHGLLLALEGHVAAAGGHVVCRAEVTAITRQSNGTFAVTVNTPGSAPYRAMAKAVVIAAGLGASELGCTIGYPGHYVPPKTYPTKGHYFSLTSKAPFERLIYPMPQKDWLGIHLTIDIVGRAKFGPDLVWMEEVSYTFDDPDGARRTRFEQEIRRYWPGLPDNGLQPDYTGVRPKIYPESAPPADFAIHDVDVHGVPGLVALYGIESPGLTSALALGEYVATLVRRR